ncbi:MAG TPA: hypothetical protein VGH98_10650 [Gemmatimonadaceae bacterium]|jgi:hypothetical protein
MPKKLKIYELYIGPSGPSPHSKYYGQYNKTLYHVAASSVKQAISLAAKQSWSNGTGPGLVEWSDGSQKFFRADGSAQWGAEYTHDEAFPRKPS